MNNPPKPFLICFSGPQGAGKTILADMTADTLRRVHKIDARRASFADPLKEILATLTADPAFAKEKSYPLDKDGQEMDGRIALQITGTDLFRTRFRDDVWVWSLLRRHQGAKVLVVDDARFVNERAACDFGIHLSSSDCPPQEGASHASESNGRSLMEMADLTLSREEGAYLVTKSRMDDVRGPIHVREIAERVFQAAAQRESVKERAPETAWCLYSRREIPVECAVAAISPDDVLCVIDAAKTFAASREGWRSGDDDKARRMLAAHLSAQTRNGA